MKKHRVSRFGYEIGLLVLLLIGIVAYQSARNYYEMWDWVLRTNRVLFDIREAREKLDLVRENLLQGLPWDKQHEDFKLKLDQLARAVQDDPKKTELLGKMKAIAFQAPDQALKADPRFNWINAELAQMTRDQRQLVHDRVQQTQKAATETFIVIGTGLVLATLFLILARISTLKDLQEIAEHHRKLKKTQEEAESASRAKSRFLANLSHEIRTPMNAVIGMSNLLLRENPRPDQKDYLETIRQSGHALLHVIQDTLDLSRIEAGKLRVELSHFDPRKLLQQISDIIRPSLHDSVRLRIDVDEKIPAVVKADAGRIQQVLLNLASNAAKFTDDGEIVLRATLKELSEHEVRVLFEVIDTGVGIPENAITDLFEPFSQVSPESRREKLGTGLGLSISKRLIEAMKGKIGVESHVGRGSRFYFDLPLAIVSDAPTELTADSSAGFDELRFSGHALVVDDNPANLKVAELTLRSLGFSVATALSGEQALHLIESDHFDLVFMDCQMPDMDGFQTTEAIRRIEQGQRTPIIALTAHASKEAVDKCTAHGMDDFLTKPIDIEHLMAVVGRFLTPVATSEPQNKATSPPPVAREPKPAPELDFEVLERLRNLAPPRGEFSTSSDVIEELIRLFGTSVARSLPKIKDCISKDDAKALAAEAHFFKSSSTSVGANAVTSILDRLEKMKEKSPLPIEARDEFERLEAACGQAVMQLQDWWKREKSIAGA